jgi:lipopolysaccharide/colanic/teichoic acid biosynthesis glycosyltransferase
MGIAWRRVALPEAGEGGSAVGECVAVSGDLGVVSELAGEALPFPVPSIVLRLRGEVDWEGFLPPGALGFRWRVERRLKRAFDIVVSLLLLLVLAPVLVAIGLLVGLTSEGPVFYHWKVLGCRARPFLGYKFRTMVPNAEALKAEMLARNEMTGPVFKMRNDPRVTPVGRFLRKYSLDELPQLWSVLRGDMSLVGPRPPSPEEFAAFKPWQRGKLAVTPGITCLWQVMGRSEISDFDDWARLDLEYIANWTFWLDLKILARTVPVVVRGRGAY